MINTTVIKANGEKVIFDVNKLVSSMTRAGASKSIAENIATAIEAAIVDNMTTKAIYKKVFTLLKKKSRPTASTYKLKKAIMELGKTGFPFEKYISELLVAEGYITEVGVVVYGKCVKHEVDVIASKLNVHLMCECKFHNKQGRTCNVKIPLYIHSRFKDVESAWIKETGHEKKNHQAYIFTNTRFTSDAVSYSECMGVKLVSWSYPEGDSIRDRINRTGVHPITCLTLLSKKEKDKLIKLDVITCLNLCDNETILQKIGIDKIRSEKILSEAKDVCKNL